MATLTPQAPGSVFTFAAASAGGDTAQFANIATPRLLVVNGSASSITVTLAGAVTCSQGFLHNQTYTCPVGTTEIVPPANTISQTSGTVGQVGITYSATTSITVAATS